MSGFDEDRLERLDAYWRAANHLTVGQIHLQDNPLLRPPLRREHIKPRLLGHWAFGAAFDNPHLARGPRVHRPTSSPGTAGRV